jgi:hypothetical protein
MYFMKSNYFMMSCGGYSFRIVISKMEMENERIRTQDSTYMYRYNMFDTRKEGFRVAQSV